MPAPSIDTTEIDTERTYLTEARAALARMRERAQQLYRTGDKVAGDPFSAESLGATLTRRIAELADDPNTPLFFGKLAFADADPRDQPAAHEQDHAGHRYHIGRRHVTDDAGEPLVLDWRASLSRRFYQASARDPQGVAVRRRFGFAGGELTAFEDEHLDRGEELGTSSRILTAEIERPRVGPMRDIVATIQPEQDELVRAGLDETICVQGAPGTGKTAVGLHRAAFLLYSHRERLRRNGVLVVGPNRAFLDYIGQVLPALGEVDVAQTSVEELVARVPVEAVDAPEAAVLKQDARMAQLLARALAARIRRPDGELTIADGSWRLRVSDTALARIVDDVRREHLPYASGRERVRARTVAMLRRQAEARRGESPSDAWAARMGRHPQLRAFVDHAWPLATPEQLVYGLLSDPAALAHAGAQLFAEAELAALAWQRPPRTVKSVRWSGGDAVLLDEAAGLIERMPSYGHIVVDEAQDLSPMQWRAIARRCEHGSVTLLGDLAQGTAAWAATGWDATLAHLGKPGARVVALTVGFRVPAAVLALANRLLPSLDVDVPAAVSLRRDGALHIHQVEDVYAGAAIQVEQALAHEGSVGVIAADHMAARLAAGLGLVATTRVTVLPASLCKGLEFDHVIVVEPAAIVAAETRGLHRLYVALTRAVSRLCVVHEQPLPAQLR